MHTFNGMIFIVAEERLYSIDREGVVSAQIGTDLVTKTGRVTMSNNGLSPTGGDELAIADGSKIYIYNVSTTDFNVIDIAASTICFLGSYFIADTNSSSFRVSNSYDGTTWDGLDIATAEASPDKLLTVINNHNELWLFGEYTTEIWYQSGSGNPPFARISSGVIDFGCAAKYSVAKGNNTLFWVGTKRNNEQGQFIGICMASGYGAKVITPHSISSTIDKYNKIDDAFGYCYTEEGHEFYVITFPSANATWVYDIASGLWHERSTYSDNPYKINRHLANAYTHFENKHYVADYRNSNIYQMSGSVYTDNNEPIASVRIFPNLSDREDLNNIFVSKLQIDAETGIADGNPRMIKKVVITTFAGGDINLQVNSEDEIVYTTTGDLSADNAALADEINDVPGSAVYASMVDSTNNAAGIYIIGANNYTLSVSNTDTTEVPSFRALTVGHSYIRGKIPQYDIGVEGNSYRREMYYRARSKYGVSVDFVGTITGGDLPTPYHDGVDGEDSTGLDSLIDTYLDGALAVPTANDCVLVGPIGFADCLNSVALATFNANLTSIVDKITAHSTLIKIFLITDPDVPDYTGFPPGQNINDYAAEVGNVYTSTLAAGKNVYKIDLNSQDIHIGTDDIHPNWLGYEQMGEYITDEFMSRMSISEGTTSVVLYDTFTDSNGTLIKNHTPDTNTTGNVWEDPNDRFEIDTNQAHGAGNYGLDTQFDIDQIVFNGQIQYYQTITSSSYYLIKSNSAGTSYLYMFLDPINNLIKINSNGGAYASDTFVNSLSTWYTFDITIRGNSIEIRESDVLILHAALTNPYNNYTRIGLSYYQPSDSRFDTLRIYTDEAAGTPVPTKWATATESNVLNPTPKTMLSWSNDGGHTWSNEHESSMGREGEYYSRLIWRRIGSARSKAFRLLCAENVKKVFIAAHVDYTKGAS